MLRHIHRCATRVCFKNLHLPDKGLKGEGTGTKNELTNIVQLQRMLLCTAVDSEQVAGISQELEDADDTAEWETVVTEQGSPKQEISSLFKFVFEKPISERKRSKIGNPYPEDVSEKDPVLKGEIKKYHRGRRWLASIMGKDPETFSQKDVDEAIEYLLPSHLTQPDARPQMKHPYEIFPALANPAHDEYGRPKHPAFYMRRPLIHDLNFQIWSHLERLDAIEEESIKTSGIKERGRRAADKPSYTWTAKSQIEHSLKERMSDQEYTNLTFRLSRLANHSFLEHDEEVNQFVKQYMVFTGVRTDISLKGELPGLHLVKSGDERIEARSLGYRKSAIADLTLRKGDGTMTVNNKPVRGYFSMYTGLELIMHPFIVTDTLNKYDFDAQVVGGGTHGQAGAIRHAVSRALVGLDPDHYGVLQRAGLLRRDTRRKERQKPGQRKARRAFQWVAR